MRRLYIGDTSVYNQDIVIVAVGKGESIGDSGHSIYRNRPQLIRQVYIGGAVRIGPALEGGFQAGLHLRGESGVVRLNLVVSGVLHNPFYDCLNLSWGQVFRHLCNRSHAVSPFNSYNALGGMAVLICVIDIMLYRILASSSYAYLFAGRSCEDCLADKFVRTHFISIRL